MLSLGLGSPPPSPSSKLGFCVNVQGAGEILGRTKGSCSAAQAGGDASCSDSFERGERGGGNEKEGSG